MPGFNEETRQNIVSLASMSKATGGGNITTQQLPKTGLAARLWIPIVVTTSATSQGTVNTAGICSAIRRVRVYVNSGLDLFNISGIGYHWGLRDYLNNYYVPFPYSVNSLSTTILNARAAVTTSKVYDCSMVLPIALNALSPIGLFVLQNEQTTVNLSIEWETDVNVEGATGSHTAVAYPYLEFFNVPAKEQDFPPINVVHQILEDQVTVPGTGDYVYNWPRGNTYLQMFHVIAPMASQPTVDPISRVRLRSNQSYFPYDFTSVAWNSTTVVWTEPQNGLFGDTHEPARLRPVGTYIFDFLGSMGNFAMSGSRDWINSAALTDLASVLTVANTTNGSVLYNIRRQLVVI